MTEEKKKHISESEIENLLAPRCGFHVSAEFQEKLLNEVAAQKKSQRRKFPLGAIFSAAAVCALVVLTAILFIGRSSLETQTEPLAEIHTGVSTSQVTEKISPADITELPATKHDETVPVKKAPSSSSIANASNKRKPRHVEKALPGVEERQKPEGEMPIASDESQGDPDPDEVRQQLLTSRRNAEIAYIDRMRSEIEETQDYIGRYMSLVNE